GSRRRTRAWASRAWPRRPRTRRPGPSRIRATSPGAACAGEEGAPMRRSPMIAAAALLALSPRASRADEPGSLEAQVEKKAPAIVSLKYVLKAEGGGGGESNGEAVGAMADPSGLVVLSNDHFSGSPQQR